MKTPPLCNYPGEGFLHQTKEEYEKTVPKWSDFPKFSKIDGTPERGKHRVRCNRKPGNQWGHVGVYITDLKRVDPPAGAAPVKLAPFVPPVKEIAAPAPAWQPPQPTKFDVLKDALKTGIQVVSAPQLFPTPPELAARLVRIANIREGHRVLEPSAGTGNLLRAIAELSKPDEVVAVEINSRLAGVGTQLLASRVIVADFLTLNGELGEFDRIVMNPPFEHGSDIKHIHHALEHLAPGGRLVAICSAGPRQRDAFSNAEQWIDLPADSFKSEGTSVNTAIVVLTK
jgi:protein-L-isoaspartate O-methyltransferase